MARRNPSMKLFRLGKQRFLCDPEATRRVYDAIRRGGHCECVADEERNFAAVRNQAYSDGFLLVLSRLGVDPEHEAETSLLCRQGEACYLYEGWFHFVGSLDANRFNEIPVEEAFGDVDIDGLLKAHYLTVSGRTDLVRDAFAGYPILQLDFCTVVSWVIDAPAPE